MSITRPMYPERQARIHRRVPIGGTEDIAVFCGGDQLASRSSEMRTPREAQTIISLKSPSHPFQFQAISADGWNPKTQSAFRRLRGQTQPRIPKPYPVNQFEHWTPTNRPISRIPSVRGGNLTSGPDRGLSASRVGTGSNLQRIGNTMLRNLQKYRNRLLRMR